MQWCMSSDCRACTEAQSCYVTDESRHRSASQAPILLQAALCKDLHTEAQAVQCDVCNDAQQSAAFEQHMRAFGSMHLALLNAGIAELGESERTFTCQQ